MIELIDPAPPVEVQPSEYTRLLGYPRGRTLEGRALELAEISAEWYAKHGRPWVYAREVETLNFANGALSNGAIDIEGVALHSARLKTTFQQAGAHSAVLVAVGAGPELEQQAQTLWREDKPDEYFFLEMYGSAVVEQLVTATGARLCAWAEPEGAAVLPHYSPGYPEWDIAEQSRLLDLVTQSGRKPLPSALEALGSGALRPKKSLLAVFGLTRNIERVRPLAGLVPCENCSFAPCQYRRAPYVRTLEAPRPVEPAASYGVNPKALRRWASERLSLHPRADGGLEAIFRYDGTTCSNMGRPLAFDYKVTLGPPETGYLIREQQCHPAPSDAGHMHMCQFDGGVLLDVIDRDKPLLGSALNSVLSWQRPDCVAGCYCDPAGRQHKWGLVLETIHYALAQKEESK